MYLTAKAECLSQEPWHYVTLRDMFSLELYERVYAKVLQIDWSRAETDFYRQYEGRLDDPGPTANLFTEVVKQGIRAAMEREFCCSFDDTFDVVAHRLGEGDFVGIHTDRNLLGESHRLVLFLNEARTPLQGGVFLTLRSERLADVRDAWLPAANTGIAFQIGDNSFHAVTPVVGSSPRYSVVFTFRRKAEGPRRVQNWSLFPLATDIRQARSTAGYMGIHKDVFDKAYEILCFESVQSFRTYVGGRLKNSPESMRYSDGKSINVDQNGVQSKGSDLGRVRAIAGLHRIPPIIVVRRKSGDHVLVDGSHRLSYATDRGCDLHVAFFDED